MANCLLGEPQSPYTTIIAIFHVVVFGFTAPFRQAASRLTIRRFARLSPFSSMDSTAAKIQALGDLELAVLLCLVAQQHCMISTQNLLLDTLAHEIQLVRPFLLYHHHFKTNYIKVATNIFGLSCALVNCSATTTLDDFRQAVLVDAPDTSDDPIASSTLLSLPSFRHTTSRQTFFRNQSGASNELDDRKIADIIIAKDLNMANTNIQTQALEVLMCFSASALSCLTNSTAYAYQKTIQPYCHAWYLQAFPFHRSTSLRV
jgi:hypothetical protein